MRLTPITPVTFADLPFAARRSVWWEVPDSFHLTGAEAEFEKEAWVSAMCAEFADCGFLLGHGAVFYCPPAAAPAAAVLPTGPVSADALLLSSLFIDPGYEGTGVDVALLHAALMQMTLLGYAAAEAFGYVCDRAGGADATGPGTVPSAQVARAAGFFPAQFLDDNGFHLVADHPLVPRYRIALPPADGLLSVAALTDMVAAAV
ncbi:MAG: hypothetical protein SPI77_03635 [Corynebacterium sp.]|nr:hypothetical protein [Corynebacterium sp.]